MAFLHRFQVLIYAFNYFLKVCHASDHEGHVFRRTSLIITSFLVALLPDKLNMHVQIGN